MEEIFTITEQLLVRIHFLKEKFDLENKPMKVDKAFFEYVKKEIDPYYALIDQWESRVTQLIKQNKISLHHHQVTATVDNVRALFLHSYYIDIRKRRYMEIYKSCDYIFNQLLKELKQ